MCELIEFNDDCKYSFDITNNVYFIVKKNPYKDYHTYFINYSHINSTTCLSLPAKQFILKVLKNKSFI